ncbi:MAG: winged helix-turn-helix domain-containing protein [Candidatus Hodarchaeales archaeon]
MLIPSEQILIHTLDHEIRRNILQLVHYRPYSYSELMDILRIDSGKLYYHLQFLTGFLTKQDDKKVYSITPLGEKAVEFLRHLSQNLAVEDIPGLCEAYTRQLDKNDLLSNINYLKAVVETVNLICKLVIYLNKNLSVSERLDDFLIEIMAKSYNKKQSVLSQIECSAIDIGRGTELRNFWCGVYDTLTFVRSSKGKQGEVLLILKRQALELQKPLIQNSPIREHLPNLQKVISDELFGFSLP